MGLNFHPRVIGRMAWKDGRDQELLMLETAAFDPIWTEFNWDREGRCTIPCLRDYGAVFKGKKGAYDDEWESYDGLEMPLLNLSNIPLPHGHDKGILETIKSKFIDPAGKALLERGVVQHTGSESSVDIVPMGEPLNSFESNEDELSALVASGVVAKYDPDEDDYPPSNRTMENFFRGAWTYHVHNQWMKHPEPSSWLAVMQSAHDGFLDGSRMNPYGEKWAGPDIAPYNKWSELE